VYFGCTPLMVVVVRGDLPTVKYLISHGADVNAQYDGAGTYLCGNAAQQYPMTALMLAAERSNPEIVRALLEAGAEPNVSTMGRRTPLSEARRLHRDANVRLLLQYGAKR
jgi:ankyrin repeat protein